MLIAMVLNGNSQIHFLSAPSKRFVFNPLKEKKKSIFLQKKEDEVTNRTYHFSGFVKGNT